MNTEINRGMLKDINSEKTPPNFLQFALNAVNDSQSGGRTSLFNEPGNESTYSLPDGHRIIGEIPLGNDEIVIFSTDNSVGSIGIACHGSYENIITDSNFNFSTESPIQGIGRIRRGSEKIVYFNDNHRNPDRVINLSRIELYLVGGILNPDLIVFNRRYSIPNVELKKEYDFGGSIPLGSYQLAMRYIDKEFNPTEFFLITNSIPVTRGSYSGDFEQIVGGYNIESPARSLDTGAYPRTTKSFLLELTNVDIDYGQLEIAVIAYRTGDGESNEVFLIDKIPIGNQDTIEYTFRGINESLDTTIALTEVTQSFSRYESSTYMAYIQNRLIRANLREKDIDWSLFQILANDVKVKYVIKETAFDNVPLNDDERQSHKMPNGTFQWRTAFRDEIHALGIVFVFTDGSVSPVFHIPGREAIDVGQTYTIGSSSYDLTLGNANNTYIQRNDVPIGEPFDKQLLTVADPVVNAQTEVELRNVEFLNLNVGDTVERWRVYNTAIADKGTASGQVESGFISSGICSYYECENRYPVLQNANGDYLFPTEIVMGDTVGQRIRHHKFPTVDLEPIATDNVPYTDGTYSTNPVNGQRTFPIGVKIFNVSIPPQYASIIQGYQLVIGDRNGNETVLDKGVGLTRPLSNALLPTAYYLNVISGGYDDSIYDNIGAGGNYNWIQFQSPLQDLSTSIRGGTFIKTEAYFYNNTETIPGYDVSNPPTEGYYSLFKQFIKPENYWYQRQIEAEYYVPYSEGNGIDPLQFIGDNYLGFPLASPVFYNKYMMYRLKYPSAIFNTAIAGMPYMNVYPTAFYEFDTDDSQPVTTYGLYLSVKSTVPVYEDLSAIIYGLMAHNIFAIGDDAIGFGNYAFITKDNRRHDIAYLGQSIQPSAGLPVPGLYEYFVESVINYNYRHEGKQESESFYPLWTKSQAVSYLGGEFENFYAYNADYSVKNELRAFFGLNEFINYQNQQLNRFPYRIAWSNKSFDEEIQDKNEIFSVLDNTDIQSNKSEIVMLIERQDSLFVITTSSLFVKPTNNQSISTNGSVATLKTEDFLSIPETEIGLAKSFYGGGQHRLMRIDCEFGSFYVNQAAGHVYRLTTNLEIISNKGMVRWLENNLPSKLKYEFFELCRFQYPYSDCPMDEKGIGVISYYDPIFKRLIITKKDFEFLLPFRGILNEDFNSNEPNSIYWNPEEGNFVATDDDKEQDSFTLQAGNGIYVRPKHWTLSYSLTDEYWQSFHSYTPAFAYNDSKNFYTFLYGNSSAWRHIRTKFTQFYGNKYPFIVELNCANFERAFVTSVEWYSICERYKNNSTLEKGFYGTTTFDKLFLYTAEHGTGLINLEVPTSTFDTINYQANRRWLKRANNVWRVNGLSDIRVTEDDAPITAQWTDSDYQAYFDLSSNVGYIESVPNSSNFDFSKNLFETKVIDNSRFVLQLQFTNNNSDEDYQLSVDLVTIVKKPDLA